MNSISVLLLALLVVCVLSHPADEQVSKSNSKSKSTARDVELEVDVKVETEKKTKTVFHPTVKCEHIHLRKAKDVEAEEKGDENHVCFSHCVTLGSEYREGKCEAGLCHCEREVSSTGNAGRVPTVKCSDLIAEGGETGEDNEEACEVHCKTLGGNFDGGKCAGGICTCRVVQ